MTSCSAGCLQFTIEERSRKLEDLIFDELKPALSQDIAKCKRDELIGRLEKEMFDTVYLQQLEKPLVLFGVAVGMRLCGLRVEEINAGVRSKDPRYAHEIHQPAGRSVEGSLQTGYHSPTVPPGTCP